MASRYSANERQELHCLLTTVVARYPRPASAMYTALVQGLNALAPDTGAESGSALERQWEALCREAWLRPGWTAFLLPDACAVAPDLLPSLARLENVWAAPEAMTDSLRATAQDWLDSQADFRQPDSLAGTLLRDLATAAPGEAHFAFLSRYYTFIDLLHAQLCAPERMALLRRLFSIFYQQRLRWPQVYCQGYAYQGWDRIGVSGIKPTEQRLAQYAIEASLSKHARVLDIGANCGFLAMAIAPQVVSVDGIEINPYLVAVANEVRDALQIENARFLVEDFLSFSPGKRYDAVFSLANHATIDGNSALDFAQYVAKLFHLLESGGVLLFESHNVFGPGRGSAGDDGDLDHKLAIAARYFEVVRYRMVPAFVPFHDVDKLFIVLRRRDRVLTRAPPPLVLAEARTRYEFVTS